jgi:hypothetical protein
MAARKCGVASDGDGERAGRMGVNARNFEPVRIRLLDGADSWNYLD